MPTDDSSLLQRPNKAACEKTLAELREDFQMRFELWIRDEGWSYIGDPDTPRSLQLSRDVEPTDSISSEQFPLGELLNKAAQSGAPQTHSLGTGVLIAVPRPALQPSPDDSPVVAIGTLPDTSVPAANRLVRFFVELETQRSETRDAAFAMNSLAEQVSSNFEELMLLREMAEHLQLSADGEDAAQAGARLLPALARTLKAEQLALVQVAADGSDQRIYWGTQQLAGLSESLCCELIDRVGGDGSRPRVINDFSEHDLAARCPSIRQLALVGIGGRSWLLAFNRIAPSSTIESPYEEIDQTDRFGTFEVTLMTSAATMLTTHFSNLDLLEQKQVMFTETVKSLTNAVDARDPYTRGHSERVGLFCRAFGKHLGFDNAACEKLYLAGLLHDIGKIGVTDSTLQKPGKLTEEEYEDLKRHPDQGWAILSDLGAMQDILPGVLYHHERFDGLGYPCGLAGEDIPIEGRLMSICDAYDAMTSDRPYRKGMPQAKAEAILESATGTQWDPRLVEEFMKVMPEIIRIRENYTPPPMKSRDGHLPGID